MFNHHSFSSFHNQTEIQSNWNKGPSKFTKDRPILFRLNFELGEGKSAKLTVREGEEFHELARQFVDEHQLEEDAMEKVLELIEQTHRIHMNK